MLLYQLHQIIACLEECIQFECWR